MPPIRVVVGIDFILVIGKNLKSIINGTIISVDIIKRTNNLSEQSIAVIKFSEVTDREVRP